jgi:hypothetical protein
LVVVPEVEILALMVMADIQCDCRSFAGEKAGVTFNPHPGADFPERTFN